MMKMKKNQDEKSQLDEMQEQKLLKIERNCAWFAFWGLLASIIIQMIIYRGDVRMVAGEWVVFMCFCLYMGIGCMKNGIWERRIRPTLRNNLLASLLAMVVTGIYIGIMNYQNLGVVSYAITGGAVGGVFVFVLCIVALEVSRYFYQKRRDKLDDIEDERF